MRSIARDPRRPGTSIHRIRRCVEVALASLTLSACSGSTEPSREPRYIHILSPLAGVPVGRTMQLDLAVWDDFSRRVPHDAVEWRTNPHGRATISSTGLMTGISVGMVEVTATIGSASKKDTLYVKPDAPLFHGVFTRPGHLCRTMGFFGDGIILSDGLLEFIDDTLLVATATNWLQIPVRYSRRDDPPDDDLLVGEPWTVPVHPARLYGTDSIEFPLDIWLCEVPVTPQIFRFTTR